MVKRRPVPQIIRTRLRSNLTAARRSTNPAEAWRLLEEAHILSQPWAWPHVKVHGAMLRHALATRDSKEARGQLLRLVVAGPGSLSGRYPVGNTGRANVPATAPMPVPADLAALLETFGG